jgi:predicted metal-binding protein
MAKIGILSCEKIKDNHCIGCIKCYKAVAEKAGTFAEHKDEIEIAFWAGCGDCPGLFMPKMVLIGEQAKSLGREFDTVHIGTCMVKAVKTAACPIDLEKMKSMIEEKWGVKVHIGTHPW